MNGLSRIAIVGGSLAGLRAAEALRDAGFAGGVTLIGAEAHPPYDRPPLSKEILRGDWQPEQLALRRDPYDALDLDLRLGVRANALDTNADRVLLDDGTEIAFDALLIATGAKARPLPASMAKPGVFLLRTLDDALAVRDAVAGAQSVAVIGAGFIGAEVAASARELGKAVTMIEPAPAPMLRGLGRRIGAIAARIHREEGVDLRLDTGVESIETDDSGLRLSLTDGGSVTADVVVGGIGAIPDTAWLETSGLELDDGVVCDAHCRTSRSNVYAAGDCARWTNPRFGGAVRLEHWTNAVEQGVYAARHMLGKETAPFAPVPMFWSDQHGVKIQVAGHFDDGDELVFVRGSEDERKFVAVAGHGDTLKAVVAFSRARLLIKGMEMIEAGVSFSDAVEALRG